MNKDIKLIERKTEKIGFLKRRTHIEVDILGTIVEEDIEHYAKPIEIALSFFEYCLPYRGSIEIAGKTVTAWKRPFQSSDELFVKLLSKKDKLHRLGGA